MVWNTLDCSGRYHPVIQEVNGDMSLTQDSRSPVILARLVLGHYFGIRREETTAIFLAMCWSRDRISPLRSLPLPVHRRDNFHLLASPGSDLLVARPGTGLRVVPGLFLQGRFDLWAQAVPCSSRIPPPRTRRTSARRGPPPASGRGNGTGEEGGKTVGVYHMLTHR